MPIYEFRCDTCGLVSMPLRSLGDTEPPRCAVCVRQMRRIYSTGGQIVRPKGYDLHPGDRGYWDFGDLNEPGYAPPDQLDPFAAHYEAERDLARMAETGDDE